MISLAAPASDVLRSWALERSGAEYSYRDVGATRHFDLPDYRPPPGFVVDRYRVCLGEGEALYETAREALLAGRMFPRDWFVAAWTTTTPQAGAAVAVAARCLGIWWWNAAKIVYVDDVASAPTQATSPLHRTAIAYGTLRDHVELGEERFLVEQLADGAVWYEVAAFSRPRHPLVRLAYPLARRMQRRFGRDSLAAMQRATAKKAVSHV